VLELEVVALAGDVVADAQQLPGDADVLAHPRQVEPHLVEVPGRRVAPAEEGPAHRQVPLVFLERTTLRLVADEALHGDAGRIAPLGAARLVLRAARLGLRGLGHTDDRLYPAYSRAATGRNVARSREKVSVTLPAVSATSACERGFSPIPAARLVM